MPVTTFHHNAAKDMAKNSPDPSTKVGAVIVDHRKGTTVGAGWNRFPENIPPEMWQADRFTKYKYVIHAEAAAIISAGTRAHGCDIYVTHHPCRECAKLIAAAGIRTVWCPEGPWRDDPEVAASVADAKEILTACGILQIGG